MSKKERRDDGMVGSQSRESYIDIAFKIVQTQWPERIARKQNVTERKHERAASEHKKDGHSLLWVREAHETRDRWLAKGPAALLPR